MTANPKIIDNKTGFAGTIGTEKSKTLHTCGHKQKEYGKNIHEALQEEIDQLKATVWQKDEEIRALEYRITTLLRP